MYCHAPVGEDSILPCGGIRREMGNVGRNRVCPTRLHSGEHSETITWREADSLPYRRLYDFRVHSNHLPSYCRGG